jgi:hypothetical protein
MPIAALFAILVATVGCWTHRLCQDAKPGGVMPTPGSLNDLPALLGLDFKDLTGDDSTGGNPGCAILGHSSALTARKVSAITPTAFVFTRLLPTGKPPRDHLAELRK